MPAPLSKPGSIVSANAALNRVLPPASLVFSGFVSIELYDDRAFAART